MAQPSKTAREVVSDGEGVPEGYACRDGKVATLGEATHGMEVPVIDLGLLASPPSSPPSPPSATGELYKLRSALASWGCFQVLSMMMNCEFVNIFLTKLNLPLLGLSVSLRSHAIT